MEEVKCPDCGERQWSVADCNYVRLFATCWSCDKKRWENKTLSLEEFEKREEESVK